MHQCDQWNECYCPGNMLSRWILSLSKSTAFPRGETFSKFWHLRVTFHWSAIFPDIFRWMSWNLQLTGTMPVKQWNYVIIFWEVILIPTALEVCGSSGSMQGTWSSRREVKLFLKISCLWTLETCRERGKACWSAQLWATDSAIHCGQWPQCQDLFNCCSLQEIHATF